MRRFAKQRAISDLSTFFIHPVELKLYIHPSQNELCVQLDVDYKRTITGKWQQVFLSSHLRDSKTIYGSLLQNFYICLTALFREIFSFEIFSCPPSWIFVDMHDTSQLGSRDFFSHDTMINMLP